MPAIEKLAGRRILFLNWRDLTNPSAGGAEAYAEQIARRFGHAGALVTLFTSQYEGAAPHDWAQEYLVVREGSRLGVYLAAGRHLKRYGRRYDAVVDCQNGIPFFAPFWAQDGAAVVCVVHHVHQRQFDMYYRWPVNRVGRLLEGRLTRRVYRDVPFVAVSPSTRAEMRHQLGLRVPIHIVPNGVEPPSPGERQRSTTPAIGVVTRLVPHKRLHMLVEAVPALLRRWPDLRVDIAGTGPARAGLLAQVRGLGLEGAVHLPGRVNEQAKRDLLSQAWLTVAPSLAEGWGLTILEANALGTPAVAYDVPGLRDSVCDGLTGWLVPAGRGLETALMNALATVADPAAGCTFARQCQRWAGRFSWDASAERLAGVLVTEVTRRNMGSPSRRQAIDLATVASWPPGDAAPAAARLRQALRVTDAVSCDQDGLRVLLTGCDELGAATALRRAGAPPAKLRLATSRQVLCGTGEDELG
jgi:glycosyltransferase involved in cell wall biosynthesis